LSLRYITVIEEAFRFELSFRFTILELVEGFCDDLFWTVLGQMIPFLLLFYFLEQVCLAGIFRVFVLDHILVFARFAENRQNKDFIEPSDVRHCGKRISRLLSLLSSDFLLLV